MPVLCPAAMSGAALLVWYHNRTGQNYGECFMPPSVAFVGWAMTSDRARHGIPWRPWENRASEVPPCARKRTTRAVARSRPVSRLRADDLLAVVDAPDRPSTSPQPEAGRQRQLLFSCGTCDNGDTRTAADISTTGAFIWPSPGHSITDPASSPARLPTPVPWCSPSW